MEKRSRDLWFYVAFFITLAGVKLFLCSAFSVVVTKSLHDEYRLVQMSLDLLAQTLPAYDQMRYIKPWGYPFFLVMLHHFQWSVVLAQEVLYDVSGFILGLTCLKYTRVRGGAYLFLLLYLWAPYSFTANRLFSAEVLSTALLLLLLSGWIYLFSAIKEGRHTLIIEMACALIMGYFWQVRPDALWIIPAFLLWIFLRGGKTHKLRLVLLPVIAISLGSYGARVWNHQRLGIDAASDLTQKQFQRASNALARIKSPERFRDIPVSRQIRGTLYTISPAFRELRPYFEGAGHHWFQESCPDLKICDDYAVGWFYWAFRDAVAYAGYYSDPAKAESFYSRVADEVNEACRRGQLNCTAAYFSPSKGDVDFVLLSDRWPKLLWAVGSMTNLLYESIMFCDLSNGFDDPSWRAPFEELGHTADLKYQSALRQRIRMIGTATIKKTQTIYKFLIFLLMIFLLIRLPIQVFQSKRLLFEPAFLLSLALVGSRVLMLAIMMIAGSHPSLIVNRYIWPAAPFWLLLLSFCVDFCMRNLKRQNTSQAEP